MRAQSLFVNANRTAPVWPIGNESRDAVGFDGDESCQWLGEPVLCAWWCARVLRRLVSLVC